MFKLAKRLTLLLAVLTVSFMLLPSNRVKATNPNMINFQGKVVNADGTNVADGSYAFRFRIYTSTYPTDAGNACSANSCLWETARTLSVTNGVFQIELGDTGAGDPALPDFSQYTNLYLGIKFNNDANGEMNPRIRLDSVPYALNSDKLGGLSSSSYGQLSANQTFTGANILQPSTDITGLVVKQNSNGSPTADVFDVKTADATGNFIQVTSTAANQGAVTVQSIGGSNAVTLNSASGVVVLGSSTTTIQKAGSGLTLDATSGSNSTVTVTNSGAGVASLSVEGGVTIGSGQAITVGATAGAGLSLSCSSGQGVSSLTTLGGVTTAGSCGAVGPSTVSYSTSASSNGGSISGTTLTLNKANGSNPGLLSADAQTIGGAKTFSGNLAANGSATFKDATNAASAFLIQNQTSATIFGVDTTTTNLLVNPSLEEGSANGWSATGGSTNAALSGSGVAYSGNRSYLYNNGSNNQNPGATDNINATLTAGNYYALSVYAKMASGSITTFQMGYSPDGTLGNFTTCLTGQTLTTNWQRFVCTFQATGSFNSSNLVFFRQNETTNYYVQLDAAQLELVSGASSTATPFRIGTISLGGGLVNSPFAIQNLNDSSNAFSIQNAAATTTLLQADTANQLISLGLSNNPASQITAPTSPSVSSCSNTGGTLTGAAGTGTTYYFKVSALYGVGGEQSAASTEVNCAIGASVTTGSISLSWTGSPGATAYRVWYGTSTGNETYYLSTTNPDLKTDYYSTTSTSYSWTGNSWSIGGYMPTFNTQAISTTTISTSRTTLVNSGDIITGGPRVDVRLYGADPTGVNDSTNAIQAAINSLASTGGEVYFPPGKYVISNTINVGNGSSANGGTASTVNGIKLVGSGSGGSSDETNFYGGTTQLYWNGADGGTMISVNGPIWGVDIQHLYLDGGGSGAGNHAATGFSVMHAYDSNFNDLKVTNWTGWAYNVSAYSNPQSVAGNSTATGTNQNTWSNLHSDIPYPMTDNGTAGGISIGEDTNLGGQHDDVAINTFTNCLFWRGRDSTAVSIRLQFTDVVTFNNCGGGMPGTVYTDADNIIHGIALQIVPPTGATDFPKNISFYNSPLDGHITVSGTWTGTGQGIGFWPLRDGDNETLAAIPKPNGGNFSTSKFFGVTPSGQYFGPTYIQDTTNESNAFQVQNATGSQVVNVGTTNTNLLTDGGFDDTVMGGGTLAPATVTNYWSKKTGSEPTFGLTSSGIYQGTEALSVQTSGTGDGAKQAVALSSNTSYLLSVYAKTANTSGSYFQMGYSGDGSADTIPAGCTGLTLTKNWQRFTCAFKTGTTSGSPYIFFNQSDSTGRFIILDSAQLEQTSTIGAFNSGQIQLNGIVTSPATFQNGSDSTTAFQVQNAEAANIFTIDTATTSNLVTNGGFEGAAANGWTAKGSSAITPSTLQSWQANNSLQISTTTAANDGAQYVLTMTNGQQYTLSFYAKVASSSISDLNAGWKNTSGGSDNACSLNSQTVTTTWQRYTCTFTASSPDATGSIFINKTGGSAETIYIDGVQLQTGSSATAFNAGGTIQIGGIINSPVAFQNKVDSGNAFQIQNASGNTLFNVDTANTAIYLGTTGSGSTSSTIHIGDSSAGVQTVTAGSTNSTSTTTIQGGANGSTPTISLQTAASGLIAIGTANSSAVTIGNTSAGAVNISTNADSFLQVKTGDPTAYTIKDNAGTPNVYATLNTQVGQPGSAWTFSSSGVGITATSSSTYTTFRVNPATVFLAGTTAVNGAGVIQGGSYFNNYSINDASAESVNEAASVVINGPPTGGGSGPVTISTSSGLRIPSAAVSNVTNAYGLNVSAPTGASTGNYAAIFQGGNVGIGTATPNATLQVNGTLNSGALTVTSSSSNAFSVGQNGSTNPGLNIDASTSSSTTGLNIKTAGNGGGLALSTLSGQSNESLTIDAKGSGTITLAGTSTGGIALTRATTISNGGLNVNSTGITNVGAISGVTTYSQSSTTATGAQATITDNNLTTGSALNIVFTNASTNGQANTASGLLISPSSPSGTGNTTDLIQLAAPGSATQTVNGIEFTGTLANFTNIIKSANFIVDKNGAVTSHATNITSSSANSLAVGQNGTTTPALQVDASTASSVTGLKITSAAAGNGIALAAISSAGQSNENLTLDAKGAGNVTVAGTSTGNLVLGNATGVTKITKLSTTNGVLYTNASDGTLAQVVNATGSTLCLTQVSSGTPTWGSCGGGSSTLSADYSSTAASNLITLNSSGGGVIIQDAATPIGADLFTVRANGIGGAKLLNVTASGVSASSTITASGGLTIGSSQNFNINGTNFTSLQGTGLTVSSGALTVSYGSSSGTSVQGNTTLTCESGTGNLTGGGTSITLGTGGTCAAINTINNPNFTTSVQTPLLLTAASTDLQLQPTTGVTRLNTTSQNNELRVYDSTPSHYTSIKYGSITTDSGALTLDTGSAAAINIGAASPVANAINLNQSTTIAAGKNLTLASGNGNVDFSASTGYFYTGTGTVLLDGPTSVLNDTTFAAHGQSTFINHTNSTTAFQIQNQSGANLFTADTTHTTNLLTNPGFEDTLTSNGNAGLTNAWDPWVYLTGSNEGLVTPATGAVWQGGHALLFHTVSGNGNGIKQVVSTLTNGNYYALSVWARHDPGAAGTMSSFQVGYSADGATLTQCGSDLSVGNSWVRLTCTFQASSPTASNFIYFRQNPSDTNTNWLDLDAAQLEAVSGPSSVSTPYHQGALAFNGVVTSPVILQNVFDSTRALQIQNAAGTSNLFIADTADGTIGIGTSSTPSQLLSVGGTTGNFTVSSTGAVVAVGVNSGSGQIQGSGGLSVSGNVTLAGTAGNTLTIGNTTGALTLASGGTSSIQNTAGALTIQTLTSGNTIIDSAGILQLGVTNSTATQLGKASTTLTINPTSWTATPTISGTITASSGITNNSTYTQNLNVNTNDVFALTNSGLTTTGSDLANFTFKNNNGSGSSTINGLTITEQAANAGGTNTSNLLNLTAAAGGTVNGISFGSNLTNYFTNTAGTVKLDSSGNLTVVSCSGCGGGSVAFSSITTGTNTSQTLTIGNSSSLTFSGSGTINASSLNNATFAAPGTIGGTTPGSATFTGLTVNTSYSQTNNADTDKLFQINDNALATTGNQLAYINFKNNNGAGSSTINGLTINEQAANAGGTNTSNLLNLTAAAGGTVNGIAFGSNFTNFFTNSGGTTKLDSSGNLTLAGNISASTTSTINGLSLSSGALTGVTGITFSSGSFTCTTCVTNTDLAGSIAYSKLSLSGSILGTDLASNIGISTTGNIATTSTGTITSAGLITASGGLTIGSSQNFTINGESYTDLTGLGLALSGTQLTVDQSAALTWTGAETFNNNLTIGVQADANTGSTFTTTNSAAGTFGADTAVTGAYSSIEYQGKLYVSTKKNDASQIYRYDGGTTWTAVTAAAGKILAGDTANVDYSILTVFAGKLYALTYNQLGTGCTSAATCSALYSYDGSTWTMINGTKGTFGSTALVMGGSDLQVCNNQLYVATIGTATTNTAMIYRYDGGSTFTAMMATAGKLFAETTAAIDSYSMVCYGGSLIIGTVTGASAGARVAKLVGGTDANTTNGTTWLQLNNATSGTGGTFGTQTTIDDVTAMTIFGGQLYIGTQGAGGTATNSAAIYRYKGSIDRPGTISAGTDWQQVSSSTIGNIVAGTGDSTTVDAVSVLKQYNGKLYAGTDSTAAGNTGALYEFDPAAVSWTKINSASGTFGSDTSIDKVDMLQELNGTFYVGTEDSGNVGSVYTWSKTSGNSYGLRFNGGSSSYGTISFDSNLQVGDNNGHPGSFLFSNPVNLGGGAFDYAEDYPTFDNSLVAGEPVAVDPNSPDHVRLAQPGDTVLGVVSANPGMRLSTTVSLTGGDRYVPIALVGRVPAHVTTFGGKLPIVAGDKLALSDQPGVLQKATGPSDIVGVALASYDGSDNGSVDLFVNPGWDGNFADLGNQVGQMATVGGLQIAASASKTLDIFDSNGNDVANIDNQGNAYFAGTITADTIKANKIEGLEILTDKISSLQDALAQEQNSSSQTASDTTATPSSVKFDNLQTVNLTALANIEAQGGLVVAGNAEFKGQVLFHLLAEFNGDAAFHGQVSFDQQPSFNSDAGGQAVINKGDKLVHINFSAGGYTNAPIVVANWLFADTKDANGKVIDSAADKQQRLLDSGISYIVANVDKTGFDIIINKPANEDLTLDWQATSIKNPQVTQSSTVTNP